MTAQARTDATRLAQMAREGAQQAIWRVLAAGRSLFARTAGAGLRGANSAKAGGA